MDLSTAGTARVGALPASFCRARQCQSHSLINECGGRGGEHIVNIWDCRSLLRSALPPAPVPAIRYRLLEPLGINLTVAALVLPAHRRVTGPARRSCQVCVCVLHANGLPICLCSSSSPDWFWLAPASWSVCLYGRRIQKHAIELVPGSCPNGMHPHLTTPLQ
jgi:hypothetical protein